MKEIIKKESCREPTGMAALVINHILSDSMEGVTFIDSKTDLEKIKNKETK
ncbi:hypothetical protein [Lactococcus lactis]|uniref:hypothetical protein n=1 Tax=Lactococcus lactis TaxID=1358 RepID=UPI00288E680B|nr:hypothetical protein [Lactococcus lactis]MDT2898509.1 hypothetical protein [Lactococcus lactis]